MDNINNNPIPAAVLAVALKKIQDARADLAPYLHPLTIQQREEILKMGDKSLAFVTKMAEYAQSLPKLMPSYLDVPGLRLASFSPERFVRAWPAADGVHAETAPVKGTAARGRDAAADQALGAALLASPKDRAELHMIVDLMRNDLGRVSLPGSVAVPVATQLDSHVNVHHLSARVTSRLRPQLTLVELLAAICPGGSITGAPKREVMGAIRSYEARARRYFMGNLFYLDDRGRFDSSILIRTLVAEAPGEPWEMATGSGIVIGSDPERERAEIAAKCGVVTQGSGLT